MTQTILELLSYENPVLRNFAFWSALLILKTSLMSFLTAFQRVRTKTFANPEDVVALKLEVKVSENVERVRRAHHNDLENIVLIVLVMFPYVLTNPTPAVAINLFRVIFAFRLLHTIVYAVFVVPQPARFLGFIVPCGIMWYMSVMVAITFAG